MTAAGKTARILVAGLLAVGAVAVAACGSEEESDRSAETPVVVGASGELASLYERGGGLLDEGVDGYREQIAALEGEGAVVNIWASWCGPCREEFPYFSDLAVERGDEVAFIGVNSFDSDDAASTFLTSSPLPYPSFFDPDEEIRNEIAPGGGGGLPATVFYDASGEITYVKYGPYEDETALAADVERYALGSA